MTSHLDGNILAGTLADFLVPDATMIEGRCGGCGRVAPLGEAIVYPDAPGPVSYTHLTLPTIYSV